MDKVLIGLSGVILGAILTVLRDLLNNHLTSKKRAEYLAIRVTCIFDRFVASCVLVAEDDGMIYGRDEQGCIEFHTKFPKIDYQSLDVDWQSLPFDLMYEILNFPSHIEESDGVIESTAEFGSGPPDYEEETEERRLQYAKLGLLADSLSTKLRSKYNMPSKDYKDWSPVGYLKKTIDKIEEIRKKRQGRLSELQSNA